MRLALLIGSAPQRGRAAAAALVIASLLGPSFAWPACADASSPPRLAGTIISGEARLAVLVGDRSETPRAVHEGEDFLGWRVESVDRERVILSRDGQSFQVPMTGDPTAVAVTSLIPPPRQDAGNDEPAGPPPPGSPVDPRRTPHGLR